jgi:UDP-N-acetylmuramoyl-tripeptide--D-alanyl-D-alanine ligase
VTAPCATLRGVTDPGRSPLPPARARGSSAAPGDDRGASPVGPGPWLPPGAPALAAGDLVSATGGDPLRVSDRPVRGAVVDSRLAVPGVLFAALPGERTDGHRFLREAVTAGAAALLVARHPDPARGEPPLEQLGDVTVVRVPDVLRGLHAVASEWRARFSPLVVGITGSLAKTSTKEAVATVLAERFRTLRSEGNQNNEIGLPLTVLRLGPEHEVAVLEMGMYTGGEIRELARIGRPSIGVVTAVQPVHLSRIGTLDAVEAAKRELVESLPPAAERGLAILNADDPRVRRMASHTPARVRTYGFADDADVRAVEVRSAGLDGMRFRIVADGLEADAAIPTLGRFAVHNALAAVAVGLGAGLDLPGIVRGLARGWAAPHRAEVIRLDGVTIVDDAYNASPGSMLAALDLLAGLPGRHVAVLGEMLELGSEHDAGHRAVGQAAARAADLLVVVDGLPGGGAAGIAVGARSAGIGADALLPVADRAAAGALLRDRLRSGDTVLLKASRGVELDLLVADLRDAFGGDATAETSRG